MFACPLGRAEKLLLHSRRAAFNYYSQLQEKREDVEKHLVGLIDPNVVRIKVLGQQGRHEGYL